MSRLIARILLSIFIFPLAALVYMVAFMVLETNLRFSQSNYYGRDREVICFIVAGGLSWLFIAGYWVLLWFKSVQWSGGRVGLTIGAVGAALIVAGIAGSMTSPIDPSFGAFVGSVTAPLLWLVGTIFAWRETAAERAARMDNSGRDAIVCPTCGYNLTGLKESRCPECGTQFTLDQLLVRQPHRESAAELGE